MDTILLVCGILGWAAVIAGLVWQAVRGWWRRRQMRLNRKAIDRAWVDAIKKMEDDDKPE